LLLTYPVKEGLASREASRDGWSEGGGMCVVLVKVYTLIGLDSGGGGWRDWGPMEICMGGD